METKQTIQNKYLNKWVIAILCGVFFFVVISVFMFSEIQRGRRNDELALSITYSAFQSDSVNLIYDNITLLKGYLTYIETNDITEEMSKNYLDRLTGTNDNYYRSITILEDTTIKWIYPRVGNEDAIGVDLSKVSGQKEQIDLVKQNRQTSLYGPVDLVQGGKGYIVRLPIIKTNGNYWGQMSIVLDADSLSEKIRDIAKQKGIQVHIVESVTNELIINNDEVLSQNPLVYQLSEKYFDWTVYVVPTGGWRNNWLRITIIFIISVMISVVVSYAVFYGFRLNENLKVLASKDSLTGLYNRHFLDDYIALVLSRADRYRRTVGFILLDLDHFKNVNDTYGHKIGDEVLKMTGKLLLEQTRANEAAFRHGGDEFLIIFPDLKTIDELHIVENRLTQAFSKKFTVSGHDILISASIGTGVYPRDGAGFDQVLHEADIKMYRHKVKNRKDYKK